MSVIGKCDSSGTFKGQLCSEQEDKNRSRLSGFEIRERTSMCRADLEKTQECSYLDGKKCG